MCTRAFKRTIASSVRNNGEQFAFVGHVKRIESQNFARSFDFLADRDRCFIEKHADVGRLRDLVKRAGHAATVGSRKT